MDRQWADRARLGAWIESDAVQRVIIALILILMLSEQAGDLDVASWQASRDPGVSAYVDHEVPEEELDPSPAWPSLTPAGVDPDVDPREQIYRTHV